MPMHSQVARVRSHLLAELRLGQRAPGEAIVIKEVASELRISPTPVREALAMLTGEGIVSGASQSRSGFVLPRLSAGGRTNQPGAKAAGRNTERFADPRYGPDPPVLRDELEPHIESLAK